MNYSLLTTRYSLLTTHYSLFIFFLGLCVGSFLNVVINRLAAGEGFLAGRSHCPNCKTELRWFELVPVLSFIFLLGKCRTCGKKISWQYPLVETAAGALFLLIFNFSALGDSLGGGQFFSLREIWQSRTIFDLMTLIYWFIIASLFILMFVYDLKHYIIPNQAVYPAILLSFGFAVFETFWSGQSFFSLRSAFGGGLFSAFIAAGFFFALIVVSKGEWMGMGDVKLALAMGFFLGWPAILAALAFSFFSGSVVGLLLVFLGRKGFKSQLPFGPFLILGTFFAAFWGERAINWYLGGFL